MMKNLIWKFLYLENLMMNGNLLQRLELKIMSVFLCDLGASVSTIPKTLCDILGFHDLDDCSLESCISLLQSIVNSPHAYSQNKALPNISLMP